MAVLQTIFRYSNHIISQKHRLINHIMSVLPILLYIAVCYIYIYKHNSTTHSCILYALIDMTAKIPACHLKIAHCGRFMPVTLLKINTGCIKIFLMRRLCSFSTSLLQVVRVQSLFSSL